MTKTTTSIEKRYGWKDIKMVPPDIPYALALNAPELIRNAYLEGIITGICMGIGGALFVKEFWPKEKEKENG